jgi:hypothetical protein
MGSETFRVYLLGRLEDVVVLDVVVDDVVAVDDVVGLAAGFPKNDRIDFLLFISASRIT